MGFLDRTGRSSAAVNARQTPSLLSHTPKHLADKILQSKSALEGERKQVTVLFADVKGSMDLAEQLDAEEWSAIMQRFFTILSEGVERFEGFVDKFTDPGVIQTRGQREASVTLLEDLHWFDGGSEALLEPLLDARIRSRSRNESGARVDAQARGWRWRRPTKRAKSESAVISSQPCSMARAAR